MFERGMELDRCEYRFRVIPFTRQYSTHQQHLIEREAPTQSESEQCVYILTGDFFIEESKNENRMAAWDEQQDISRARAPDVHFVVLLAVVVSQLDSAEKIPSIGRPGHM